MYKKLGEKYEYDGDFEQYLLDIGVSAEHIKRMKEKKLQEDKNKYFLKEDDRKTQLVPLQKVIGTSRSTVGDSVFENVRTMQKGDREPYRFENCFKFRDKMSLDELLKSYGNLSRPVEMTYYKDNDEYFLTVDGNHRTLTAMLLGAQCIKANVTVMVLDKEKREKYLTEQEFYNQYSIAQILKQRTGIYQIVFKDVDRCYVVNGFKVRGNESCYDIIDRLSNEIEMDKRNIDIYLKVPTKTRKILRYFLGNKRFLQYMEKRNLADGYYRIVRLCEC